MKQKSLLFFAASWLVVRLRLALLSTKGLMVDLWQRPGLILVAPRHEAHTDSTWRWDGARIHFIYYAPENTNIQVRSFSEMGNN